VEAEEALLVVAEEVVPEVAAALGVVVAVAAEEVSRRMRYAVSMRDSHEPASLGLRSEETTVPAAATASNIGD
jgi:hypothetical protein